MTTTDAEKEFKQWGINLDRFHFILEETGIRMKRKRITVQTETFVDYEDIGSKIIREKSRKLIWLGLSVLFLTFAIGVFLSRINGGKVGKGAEFFHLTVSAVLFLVFLMTRKNILYLAQSDNSNAIEFLDTKRYRQPLDNFIKLLLQRRDAFLIEKYATLDDVLPYSQQYNNLIWLYNLKLLTKEQLLAKIAELDRMDIRKNEPQEVKLAKIIGFKRDEEEDEEEEDEEEDE